MMRDLQSGKDKQAEAALMVIAAADADILLLSDLDWDFDGQGLTALVSRLAGAGRDYGYVFTAQPNSGRPSGVDLDGDGSTFEARDALGYGWFTGDSGLAILSRYPLIKAENFSNTLWSAFSASASVLSPEAQAVVPLATTAQWRIALDVDGAEVTLITMAAGTPVFDGPEDRNGKRNADELAFVASLASDVTMPIVLGRANLDPDRGEGERAALMRVLTHPALQDPVPARADGKPQTADWDRVGPMRVDYILPSRAMSVTASGVIWPLDDSPLAKAVVTAGSGRLVWVDVSLP